VSGAKTGSPSPTSSRNSGGVVPLRRRKLGRTLIVGEAMPRLADVFSGIRVAAPGAGVDAGAFVGAPERSVHMLAVAIEPCAPASVALKGRWVSDHVGVVHSNGLGVDPPKATADPVLRWLDATTRLRPKFERELAPDTRVVSRCHAVPGWIPVEHDREADVLLYVWPRSGVRPAALLNVGRLTGGSPDPSPPRAPV
jgi:hypothetical protein